MQNEKELLEELRKQDEELHAIFARREEIARQARENGSYNRMVNALFDDHKSHYDF